MDKPIKSTTEAYSINYIFFRQNVLYLLMISFIYFFPYLTTDYPFDDDFARRNWGGTAHYELGRPFASTIMSLPFYKLQFGLTAVSSQFDIGAFNQILSLIVIVISTSLLLTKIYNSNPSFFSSLIGFAFIANPFYLQTFSYTSDSIIISSATALALISSLRLRNFKLDLIIGSILLITAISTYQSTINIFLATTFFLFIVEYQRDSKESLINLTSNFFKLFAAILVYKFLILSQIHGLAEYYFYLQELIKFDKNFIPTLLQNFKFIFKNTFLVFVENKIIIFFSAISIFFYALQYILKNKKPIQALFVFIVGFSGIVVSIIGFLCICAHPSIEPRVFGSFSILIIFIFYCFFVSIAEKKSSLKYIMLIPITYFFILSYGYRSMTTSQVQFQINTAIDIKTDLEEIGFNDNALIKYYGYLEFTPTLSNILSKNQFLNSLSREHLKSDWYYNILFKYIGVNSLFNQIPQNIINQACHSKAKIETPQYKITNIEKNYIVALKNSDCYQTMM